PDLLEFSGSIIYILDCLLSIHVAKCFRTPGP
ncbi:unnamed protein product, partial [marine sediment metagenome]